MKKSLVVVVVVAVTAVAMGAQAAGTSVRGPNRVGPIRMNETTKAKMKELFGEPTGKKVIPQGCTHVLRLKWDGITTYSYKGTQEIVDVRVNDRVVRGTNDTYRFETRRGLAVGDTERELNESYPNKKGITHAGHTHYILAYGTYDRKLLAKVVDGRVTQLEAAPYEFC